MRKKSGNDQHVAGAWDGFVRMHCPHYPEPGESAAFV